MQRALVLFPTTSGRRWLSFTKPSQVLTAQTLAEVPNVVRAAQKARDDGMWAVLMLAYDAAPAFDAALVAHRHADVPLAHVGIFEAPTPVGGPIPGPHEVGEWEPSQDEDAHAAAVGRVREHLANGDSYQVNLTTRFRAPFSGSAEGLFARLSRAQGAAHAAYIELDGFSVCSASPELLFRQDADGRVVCRPMKGTARRGVDGDADGAAVAQLRSSPKERAENTMIVDMVRNDLGRIAEVGTVEVPSLHAVEHYPTVHQMTSRVQARSDASLWEILCALFPGASVTGAPKVRTSQIIADLEPDARGIYCGSLGVLSPDGVTEFNLAIRTVWVDHHNGTAEYGVGGGIVWDSVAGPEWQEIHAKAAVLTTAEAPYKLLETMRWDPSVGIVGLEEHLARLVRSAAFLSFSVDPDHVRQQLAAALADDGAQRRDGAQRVRMLVDAHGAVHVETAPVQAAPANTRDAAPVWQVPVAAQPLRSEDVFLQHKTTERFVYDRIRAAHAGSPDVVLWNEDGLLTETTIGNLVLDLHGQLVTPALAAGLLAGTQRQRLLDLGEIAPAILRVEDLQRADSVWMVNAVRGWVQLEIVPSAS